MKNKLILIIFLLLTITSIFFINRVNVNYKLEEYLPRGSEIKQGLDVYQDEFGVTSRATFTFDETNLQTALLLKQEILSVENVEKVIFADDYFNEVTFSILKANMSVAEQAIIDATINNLILSGMSFPEAFISLISYMTEAQKIEFQSILTQFVSGDEMLMHVIFSTGQSEPETEVALNDIKTVLDASNYNYHFAGGAVSTIFTRNTIEKEVLLITLIIVPIILFILLLMSKSFFDIVLFGIVVGIAVVINLGTNALLPNISFITQSMAIALQLAISLDYVIFLLSAYHQNITTSETVEEAIGKAKKQTRKPIIASALTTGASFLALVFMRFTIGFDIGIVFAKAILISLITTIILLPILIKYFAKTIAKTTKKDRSLIKGTFAKKINKYRYFFLGLLIVVLAGSVYVQSLNNYTYGSSSFAGTEGTEYYKDLQHIQNSFGKTNEMILLVSKDDMKEGVLYQQLSNLDYVSNITAGVFYKQVISDPAVLAYVTSSLYSDEFALVQFNLTSDIEGDNAFQYYENIDQLLEDTGFTEYYLLGETSVAYNIRDTVSFDYNLVLVIALFAIMIIILITFKNLLMPILLPLVIETSVFFTMALLYFLSGEVVFLASLVVSAILLGVTIDYAILLSKGYMNEREKHSKEESIELAIQQSAPSIVTSALLFSVSGLTIFFFSSIQTISQIGLILAVGAVVSLFYVLIVLPQLLSIFDKWICKSKIK